MGVGRRADRTYTGPNSARESALRALDGLVKPLPGIAYTIANPASPEMIRRYLEDGECPFCGKRLKNIAGHTNRSHGVDKYQLKEMAGIPKSRTASPAFSEELSDRAKTLAKANPERLKPLLTSARPKKRKYSKAGRATQVAKLQRTWTPENWAKVGEINSRRRLAETKELDAEVVRLLLAGETSRGVKERLGVSTTRVHRILRRNGITINLRKRAAIHRGYTEALAKAQEARCLNRGRQRQERIHRWHALGRTWGAVDILAEEWGVTPKTVVAALKTMGEEVPDGRRVSQKRFWKRPAKAERKCEFAHCDQKHLQHGMCSLHYQRWKVGPRRHGVSAERYITDNNNPSSPDPG